MTAPSSELRHRRTKIIATLGPATDSPDVMRSLIDAGVDVVRLNFSHGTQDEHRERAERVREMTEPKYHLAILGDLQGPKIRITGFRDGSVTLKPGDPFTLDPHLEPDAGTSEAVGLTYSELSEDVRVDDHLLLDDGRLVLQVKAVESGRIITETVSGGVLQDAKGVNRAGGGLSAASVSSKDQQDIRLAAEIGVDYLAVSYPRSGGDIYYARELLREAGWQRAPDRKDRTGRSGQEYRRDSGCFGCHHGGARRLGRGDRRPGTAGRAEKLDPQGLAAQSGRHHGDADDGIHDYQ